MRPIQLVILLVAFIAAGAAGMIAMNLAKRPAASGAASPVAQTIPSEEVLVASGDIKIGAAVTPETLVWTQWPAGAMPQGFIVRRERPDAVTELQGTLARAPILAGEPIREVKLVRSDRGFLSAVLPKGMRAVAVRVNAASTAGGFILPNDRVDVLLVRQGNGSGGEAQSETILANIRVLAIDQTVEGDDTEQKAVVVAQDTATLELTPEQAELVTQAQQIGTISLSLRSIEDSTTEASVVEKPTGINVVRFGIPSRVNARQVQ
jgi:pilus assembly protein CpaB